jgi:hypothetical protein
MQECRNAEMQEMQEMHKYEAGCCNLHSCISPFASAFLPSCIPAFRLSPSCIPAFRLSPFAFLHFALMASILLT